MKQVRFVPNDLSGLQVREGEDGQKSREVVGRAIAFGVRSVNLTPWSSTRVVYEVLEPGCLSQELLNRSDVVYNLNHNNDVPNVLGRFRNTEKDTLKLELRADGLYTACDMPDTNNANDALVLIERGDINGQSFAFEDDWEDTENGVSYERTNETIDGKEVWLRHVKKITGLYDVAIVTHPAYEQTSVGMREASDRIDAAIEAQIKREADAAKDDKGNIPADTEENKGGGAPSDESTEEIAKKAAEAAAAEEAKKKEAEEAAKREQEERELEEQEQRFRETRAMRLRAQRKRTAEEIESLNY